LSVLKLQHKKWLPEIKAAIYNYLVLVTSMLF